jgi:DNA-binding MarR family transcriptional regulator
MIPASASTKRHSRTKAPPRARRYRVLLSSDTRPDDDDARGSRDFVIAESIAHLIVVTARLLDRRLAMRLRAHNVPIGQWPFLLFLWANKDLSQRELSKLEEATVTNTIDRMERDGLVSRTRRPTNRRRNQLRLTERGQGLLNALMPEAIAVEQTAKRGMLGVEIAFLTTLIRRVQANLSDERAMPLGVRDK